MPCISGLEIDRPPNLCEWRLLPFYYCGRASTCVDTVARLFDILESGSLALTLAVFAIEPMLIGVTSIVTVAKAPVVRLPMVHMTVLVPLQLPWEGFALRKDTPNGSASVTRTPVAAEGPRLVTVIR
jgi:hypothetical protein